MSMKTEHWMQNKKIGMITSYILLILDSVIGVFYTPMLLNALGQTQYGLYDIVNSITAYIAIADIGLGGTITRYIIKYNTEKDSENEKNCITTAIIAYFVIALVCLLVGIVAVVLFPVLIRDKQIGASLQEAQLLLLISVLNIVLTLFMHAFSGIALAYSYFSFEKILKIIRICLRFGLVFLLVGMTGKAVTLAEIDIALTVCMLAAFLLFFRKCGIRILKGKFNKPLLGAMLGFTVAILFQSIINQINTTAGKLIIGWREVDFDQVTVYGIIAQIYFIYCNMSTVIQNIYYPSIGRAVFDGKGRDDLTRRVAEPSRIQAGILYIILIGFWVFGREFVELWVGIESQKIWLCAAVMMTASTLHLSQNTISCILKAQNKLRPKTIILGCGAATTLLVGIIGSVFMDPIYAVVGGISIGIIVFDAMAMNIYYAKSQTVHLPLFFKHFFQGYWFVLPLTALAAIGIHWLIGSGTWWLLIAKIAMTVLVYIILMLLLGLTPAEKQMVFRKFTHKEKENK